MMLARHAATVALLATALVPAAASAAPRGEARKLLAPVKPYAADVGAHIEEMRAAVKTAAEAHAPCQAHIDELLQHKERGVTVVIYLSFDAIHAIIPTIQPHAERAAARFQRMTVRDRWLRGLARAKAREIRATLLMPEIDVCAMLEQWKADGYRDEDAPDPFATLAVETKRDLAGARPRVLNRALKRLKRLGARLNQVVDLLMLPLPPALLAKVIPPQSFPSSGRW